MSLPYAIFCNRRRETTPYSIDPTYHHSFLTRWITGPLPFASNVNCLLGHTFSASRSIVWLQGFGAMLPRNWVTFPHLKLQRILASSYWACLPKHYLWVEQILTFCSKDSHELPEVSLVWMVVYIPSCFDIFVNTESTCMLFYVLFW